MGRRVTPEGWHGMLMKGELVRATYEDRKTQTRRVVTRSTSLVDGSHVSKRHWESLSFDFDRAWSDPGPSPAGNPGPYLHVPTTNLRYDGAISRVYPRWKVGDRIWVRETFFVDHWLYPDGPVEDMRELVHYRVDHNCAAWEAGCPCRDEDGRSSWRSGRAMPWWASRLALEITSLRVERLQEITEEDARAEGCTGHDPEPADEGGTIFAMKGRSSAPNPLAHFMYLWDEINAARGYPWASNPWVWVIGYRRLPGTPSKEAARGC